ncbi:aminodeoxychorismate synthase component I [Sphingomonas quercus]|uniref:Aminodeoxychorismate synthase component I n=1 Tax=Sphingomonas quercus TaxID=2842451 RepID=A0ABS6BII8_9SPHN|nr:aminodeoxychorismate synthase component I [Sphingomonas quercus]MBU3078121.1 aminodeoxychorismate synthase component I [Sphingomonas quercus]
MAFDRENPFVLLDDARAGGAGATLYHAPHALIVAREPGEVAPALARLRAAVAGGARAAGFLSYEAGAALEPRLAGIARAPAADAPPLLWFGLFDAVEGLDPDALDALLGDPAGAHLGEPRPRIGYTDYAAAVARVQALIAAGDIYQANLTFQCDVTVAGDPLAAYARLRGQQAGWGGVAFTGAHWLLSASPELFFTVTAGVATARPMKGTAARHADPEMDAAAAAALRANAKQRAENLMIVDLLRNDLAHVARPGGVAVPELFTVETYPTVHHMTSTVTAALAEGRDAVDLLGHLFPCGSITGAPKIRAIEVIDAVEGWPRGPYTGAIGRIDAPGEAAFNVAIRTLVVAEGASDASLGLGSAIVADSSASAEWAECAAKGVFVTAGQQAFDLIETMRFEALDGFVELERHLKRIKESAEALGFSFDRHQVRNELQAASFPVRHDARVRLRLGRSGATAIAIDRLPPEPDWPVSVRLMPRAVDRDDFRLYHKTSDREFYDRPRQAAGVFEAVFYDADGFITEGSFTSVFLERDGLLVTPPAARGLLPGTLRGRLLDEGRAIEADLRPADLERGFLIGNTLRGLMPARLVADAG